MMKIYELNADCLFEIYKYLSGVDILNVCSASVELATFTFDNGILNRFIPQTEKSDWTVFERDYKQVRAGPGVFVPMMEAIGERLTYVTIHMERTGILNSELKSYCAYVVFRSCPVIQMLNLFGMRGQVRPACAPPLRGSDYRQLRTLALTNCSFPELGEWLDVLSDMPVLEELLLHDLLCQDAIHRDPNEFGEQRQILRASLRKNFHRLRCTRLKYLSICCEPLNPDVFVDTLDACSGTLLELYFDFGKTPVERENYPRYYRFVSQRMPQLEALLVRLTEDWKVRDTAAFESVSRLCNLRKLHLEQRPGRSMFWLRVLIRNSNPHTIRHLVLVNSDIRDRELTVVVDEMCNRLRVLELRWCHLDTDNAVNWFDRFISLRELHMYSFTGSEEDWAYFLLDAIKSCPHLKLIALTVPEQSPCNNKGRFELAICTIVETMDMDKRLQITWETDGFSVNFDGGVHDEFDEYSEILEIFIKAAGDNVMRDVEPVHDYILRTSTDFTQASYGREPLYEDF